MLDKLTGSMDFQARALLLRSERQRTIASNIANVDTPGFVARDYKFGDALQNVMHGDKGYSVSTEQARTNRQHMAFSPIGELGGGAGGRADMGYSVQAQPNMDNNTVDLDRERANFVDNTVRYEAALRFINGQSKTMLAAITGQ
ncbi:flagellar basal body rod protein FlgB [Pseudorhodoferax sp. Leaf267]|uniref:flagellar basal body rod protein FlgB n=1 Tax=Pseudorhodoferax sp. Leaf267 TaxID=1736316 RepID=UPI0006FC369F|nr:flagellar basal body rod protein FlgB [Pseudorhodoferax sp. Leaf267]KQP13755.1 flagellar biosynthesis protein FlgB [Pseudorhodoferax sp. Leaf267]